MSPQKFHRGDHVRTDDDKEAVVVGSYNDQYGPHENGANDYTLYVKGEGECSWYHASELELVRRGQAALIWEWEKQRQEEAEKAGDLDWIFAHPEEVLYGGGTPHETIVALAWCPLPPMWSDEGSFNFAYHLAGRSVMRMAEPFLLIGDKELWLQHVALLSHKILGRLSDPYFLEEMVEEAP